MPSIHLEHAGKREATLLVYVSHDLVKPTQVRQTRNGILHIHLNTAATGESLNRQLVRYLAQLLGVPESHIRIAAGAEGHGKIVIVEGLSIGEVERRMQAHLGSKAMPRFW